MNKQEAIVRYQQAKHEKSLAEIDVLNLKADVSRLRCELAEAKKGQEPEDKTIQGEAEKFLIAYFGNGNCDPVVTEKARVAIQALEVSK